MSGSVFSWPKYRFLRRQVRWYSILLSLRILHNLLWSTQEEFGIVNKSEVDVFLELSHFFCYYSMDVGNLISGSSAFSKSIFYIYTFSVHELLKPCLGNFVHYFASVWDEYNCVVVWHSLAFPFFGIGMNPDLLQSCDHCWVFHICWHSKCSSLIALSLGLEITELKFYHLHSFCF